MDPSKWPQEPMSPEVKGGRGPLLFAAKLHFAVAFYLGTSVSNSDPQSLARTMRQSATINLCIGAAFVVLWAAAKAKPLPASVAGLVLLVAAQIVNAVHNPGLLVGIVPALIILGFMIRSISAARAAAAWERQEG